MVIFFGMFSPYVRNTESSNPAGQRTAFPLMPGSPSKCPLQDIIKAEKFRRSILTRAYEFQHASHVRTDRRGKHLRTESKARLSYPHPPFTIKGDVMTEQRKKLTLQGLFKKAAEGKPITWLTCYDYPTAYLQ